MIAVRVSFTTLHFTDIFRKKLLPFIVDLGFIELFIFLSSNRKGFFHGIQIFIYDGSIVSKLVVYKVPWMPILASPSFLVWSSASIRLVTFGPVDSIWNSQVYIGTYSFFLWRIKMIFFFRSKIYFFISFDVEDNFKSIGEQFHLFIVFMTHSCACTFLDMYIFWNYEVTWSLDFYFLTGVLVLSTLIRVLKWNRSNLFRNG